MLVLSRKTGEKVVIGSDIVISVVEVRGNRVRLGIEAPADVRVLRGELTLELPVPQTSPNPQANQSLWIQLNRDNALAQTR